MELALRTRKFFFRNPAVKSVAPKSEDPVAVARELSAQGNAWSALQILRVAHEKTPSNNIAVELSALIGTSSRYSDILASMDAEFDNDYYLAANPDVRSATHDGFSHYLLYGWKENRNPSASFDALLYRRHNIALSPSEFPLSHFMRNRKKSGDTVNLLSEKIWFNPTIPTDEEWQNVPSAKWSASTQAVVIIPIFKGFGETMRAIYQALLSRQNERYSLLVINDQSPDAAINQAIQSLSDQGLFDYHLNTFNYGFVRTCNIAINELSKGLDVVLLNSDAYVFPGWFGRLQRHALCEDVATVTPLSNNATICSYPLINTNNLLALECTPQEIDQFASETNAGRWIEAPTGVGFCLYIKRAVLDEVGIFDADTFKIGYGEENDFCMRALYRGYKNRIAGDVFVYHTGSVSFSTIKDENFNRGQYLLSAKHPNYQNLVQDHLLADPAQSMRRRLDAIRLLRRLKGCAIFVAHKWSGGINTYLAHTLEELKSQGQEGVVLRVHDSHLTSIEVVSRSAIFIPNLTNIDLRTNWLFIRELLTDLSPSSFHINSFAGLDWVWHQKFLDFIGEFGSPITFVGHDYSPISHHYQLLRPDNIFVGAPDLEMKKEWAQMNDGSGGSDVCMPEERFKAYAKFFSRVDRIEVPSLSTRDIYQTEFPSARINVVPHLDHLPDTEEATRRSSDGMIRVAIVGAIGPHKGRSVLTSLAMDAKNRCLPIEYYLIGYSDSDSKLRDLGVNVTGSYSNECQALCLLDEIQPDLFFVPSIWPETFCYTLSMALKKKIPPVVFDIGAQAERVRGIAWGKLLPIEASRNASMLSQLLMSIPIDEFWDRRNMDEGSSQNPNDIGC